MTKQQKQELYNALSQITEIDRQAGCSDQFFRRVHTSKIKALVASGLIEALKQEIDESEENEL